MAKDPAFLFYPNDWIGGTMGMTFEEKGAYMELLMMQFNRGHMTSQMIAQTVGQIWDKLQDKFKKDEQSLWYNERLEIEKENRKSFVLSRYNNLKGENQYTKNNGHLDGHTSSRMEDVNEDDNDIKNITLKIEFGNFWNLYDKKVGDKIKIFNKWKKLSKLEKGLISEYVPKYKSAQPDKKYRKNPETFLNNKSWNDEIIAQNGKKSTEDSLRAYISK